MPPPCRGYRRNIEHLAEFLKAHLRIDVKCIQQRDIQLVYTIAHSDNCLSSRLLSTADAAGGFPLTGSDLIYLHPNDRQSRG